MIKDLEPLKHFAVGVAACTVRNLKYEALAIC
jgi:hypothetical protein